MNLIVTLSFVACNLCLVYWTIASIVKLRKTLQQPQPIYQESEIIGKAIELQNAYCKAIYHITERVDITECEDKLLREVNMKQRNFLYHLRKLNPDYTIIKNH